MNFFAFKPKVKTVAEKFLYMAFALGYLVMEIIRVSRLSRSIIFITFSYKSRARFLFKLLQIQAQAAQT